MSETTPLWKQLGQCDWFEHLAQQTKKHQQIEKHFLQHLDSSLQDQCQVYQFREGCLYVAVKNGAMAMRLRYLIPTLIKELKKNSLFTSLLQIECKVIPEIAEKKLSKETPKLSSRTAQLIAEEAENIQHPSLQAAMRELAKVLKQHSK
jgi:hypothetical protein